MLASVGWEHALTVVLAGFAITWWGRVADRPPEIRGDALVLRYPPAVRWVMRGAGALLFLLSVLGSISLCESAQGPGESLWLPLVFLPLVALGVAPLLEARVFYELDAKGLRGRTAFRGRRSIVFAEIAEITWSDTNRWLVLRSRGGERLRISRFLVGQQALWMAIEAKVPAPVWQSARQGYEHSTRLH